MVEAILEVPEFFLGASPQPKLNSHLDKSHSWNQGAESRPLAGKIPKCSWVVMGAENPSQGQKRTFCRIFSPGFGSLEMSLLQLCPSPALQLHWGVTGAVPATFLLLPWSSRGSSGIPIPAIPTQSQILALLRYLLFFFF